MTGLTELLRRHLVSDAPPLSPAERWRSTLAGLFGLLLFEGVLFVLPLGTEEKRILAPLGATSVILFALPHSPLAQPWSVIGGLLISAPLGYACGYWLPSGPWVMAVALAASIWLTAWARCIHPPAGAMALTMTMAAAQGAAIEPALMATAANTIAIMVAVMVVNNLIPGRHYPQGTPPAAQQRMHRAPPVIAHRDLEAALGEIDGFLDVRDDDLVDLYERTLRHAFMRVHQMRCSDLIERSDRAAPALEFATPLADAWQLMRTLRVDTLPVVDRSRRVIGLLSLEDFLREVSPDANRTMGDAVRHLLARSQQMHSDKAEVVGQMMRDVRDGVLVLRQHDGVGKAAEAMAAGRQTAVPVINGADRLVGLLDRTDLVAALYHRMALVDARSEALNVEPDAAPAQAG
ncbi:CBS domain protein [Methyloversatilis sp. RAC08]|nr:CBS domain protein [Methyloversatilis sp. RAC08]